MRRQRVTQSYPSLEFRPRTLNVLAQLTRVLPECVHLETEYAWMATFNPDILFLRGKSAPQRENPRPEVSLCRACLFSVIEPELAAYRGRVVAFEPDAESFTQYFFIERGEFEAAGLISEVGEAIGRRLGKLSGSCEQCDRPARWLWFSRAEVQSLDDVGSISAAPGLQLCAKHGARQLCAAFESIAEANLFYVNIPYGESGAYVWI